MKIDPVDVSEAMARTTMEVQFQVTGVRWFKVKLWFASRLIKLAARLLGCGIEFK